MTITSSAPAEVRSRPRTRLRWQFSWSLAANTYYGLCNLLLLVALNKLGSEAAAGQFSLALALTAPVFQFASMRFGVLLATDTRREFYAAQYFQLRLLMAAIGVLLVGLIVGLGAYQHVAFLALIVACAKAAEQMCDLCRAMHQRIERVDRVAVSLTVNGTLLISLFTLLYWWKRDVVLASSGLLLARLITLVCWDWPRLPKDTFPGPQWTAQQRRHSRHAVFLQALPLGFTAALLSLTSNTPRYLIAGDLGDEALGIYSSIAVILQAGTLIFHAIELPLLPRLARSLEENDAASFWRVLNSLFAGFFTIGIAGAVFCWLFGSTILTILFTSKYAGMGGLLSLLVLANAMAQTAGIIESSLIAARRNAVQLPMHACTSLVCVVLSVVLIPRLGLYGAVLALVFCRLPFVVIGVLLLRHRTSQGDGGPVARLDADSGLPLGDPEP